MRSLLFVVALLALIGAADAKRPKWTELTGYTFDRYCDDFGREYHGEQYDLRKSLFEAELQRVQAHNVDKSQTYKMGVNHFSDWTQEEKKNYNKYKQAKHLYKGQTDSFTATGKKVPAVVDYRTWTSPRVLSGVKNQGACGGCWGFSAAETMESQFAFLTGQLPVLSTQQIISCTGFGMQGCGGGDYFAGWQYLQGTTGLNEEWLYPFTDFFAPNETLAGTSTCQNITKLWSRPQMPGGTGFPWLPKAAVPEGNSALVEVTPNSAEALIEAIATVGPQSISVAASTWGPYEGGIYQNNMSYPSSIVWGIDHAVQAVGYGHDFDLNMDYWIVRNSWGTEWGEDGFIRLARGKTSNAQCGTVPESGGQQACGTSGLLFSPGYPQVAQLKKKNL